MDYVAFCDGGCLSVLLDTPVATPAGAEQWALI